MHLESPETPNTFDVIILGAGASGLSCSIASGARGKTVLLIDHAAKAGVKMLLSGGGKCNLTNRRVSFDDYAGENPQFCRSALSRFTPEAFVASLEQAGIALEEREEGQIFCARSAKDIHRFFVGQSLEQGCSFAFGESIRLASFSGDEKIFSVTTNKNRYHGRKLVIATGGPACPGAGATGIGYTLAKEFRHEIIPPRPALVGLRLSRNNPFLKLSGISLRVNLYLLHKGKIIRQAAKNLPLLFTHTGLSGPAALQASLFWRPGMLIRVDFLPDLDAAELSALPGAGKILVANLLKRHLPDRLATLLLPPELTDKKAATLSRAERERLYSAVHDCILEPHGPEGLAKAEVTAGGVSTRDVSSRTMESALRPGLFFCGEVLDVTGRLGGYNLHWAFASGKAAGEHV